VKRDPGRAVAKLRELRGQVVFGPADSTAGVS
jgi:hypothetical protein